MFTPQTASLFAKLRKSQRLPSPPGTALRVLELCRRDDSDVKEITDAVAADPALSGRLLRYANSAVMGSGREVTSVRDAVLYLGVRTVKLTALGFSLASPMDMNCPGFSLKRFWTESVVTAIVARRLSSHFRADREEAFTAGLLAKIGRLALAQGLPEQYAAVQEAGGDDLAAVLKVERGMLETDHVEFGAKMLSQWGIPERLVQAVRHHAEPLAADERVQSLARTLNAATMLAPLFVGEGGFNSELKSAAREMVENTLGLGEQAWQQAAEEIVRDYQQVSEVFDLELDPASMFDLYAEAQEEATRVGIVAQLERGKAIEANEDLLKRATTDALTGVANRARFDERIEELIRARARGHGDFALLLMDVDHFKRFNDTHGHLAGDEVLKGVARAVRRTLREVDLLARYGGEEFAILAPQTDQRGACIIAARTRKCVEDMRVSYEGNSLNVTISIGLVLTSDYKQPPNAKQIIADADRQLYLSKETGRNTWSYMDRSAAQLKRAAATVGSVS